VQHYRPARYGRPEAPAKAAQGAPGYSTGYATGLFGKWHLGEEPSGSPGACADGQDRPILAGFDYFDGIFTNRQPEDLTYLNYWRTKVRAPCQIDSDGIVNTYMTDDIADAAEDWIGNAPEPWFAWVAFLAAHKPFHCPPETNPGPYVYDGLPHDFPCTGTSTDSSLIKYRSMIEALDLDFGDLLGAINLTNTLVIVVSDNGSPSEVAQFPFEGKPAKGTLGQGGIWVPLIIGGNGVPSGVVPAGQPVGVIDLYRTILSAAGFQDSSPGCATFPAADDDSCDLTSYFTTENPTPPVRPYLYSETFYPNFDPAPPPYPVLQPGPSMGQQAIRNKWWKYARTTDNQNWLYNLQTDPEGDNNLFPPPENSTAWVALLELEDKLDDLLPGGLLSICQRKPVGQTCSTPEECCSEVCAGSPSVCGNPPPNEEPACPEGPLE
jgi:arylsulfatase A-like enzyme